MHAATLNTCTMAHADHSLLDDLRLDAAILRRKQQRKGIEYKLRDAPQRPSLHAVAAATAKARTPTAVLHDARLAPLSPTRPVSAPTGSHGGVRLPSVPGARASRAAEDSSLDAYDPKMLADREQRQMEDIVSHLREQASSLHHELAELARKREKLLVELGKLQHEDSMEQDRIEGMQDIEACRARNDALAAQLEQTEAYRLTLEHMLNRCRNNRVDALETQKAFEEALALNRHELQLKLNVVLNVLKSRDDEVGELQRMHKTVQMELADMDRKLEARRHEVALRQEQARLRNQRREAEARAGLSGDVHALTAADIRELQERAEALETELASARAAKVRAVNEADAAEADFNKIRFAAGVLTTDSGEHPVGDDADMSASASSTESAGVDVRPSLEESIGEHADFPVPDVAPLLDRFSHLEVEMRQIEEQVNDYGQRYKVLRYREAQLQAIKQPKARDEQDEAEDDEVLLTDALRARGAAAKRAAEAAANDLKEAEAVKLQLQQSIQLLSQRLDNINAAVPAELDPDDAYNANLEEVHAMMSADAVRIPSEWCHNLHEKLISTVASILRLQRAVDPDVVADNVADTRVWLESQRLVRSRRASSVGTGLSIAVGGRAASPDGRSSYRMDIPPRSSSPHHSMELEATIDKLMEPNECSVRVKPSTASRRPAAESSSMATAKVLADAAQAFEKQLRDFSGRSIVSTASGVTDDAHSHAPVSRASSRMRRRNSRLMVAAAYAAADAALPLHDGDGEDVLLQAVAGEAPRAPSRSGTSRSDGRDGATRLNLPKPKPRELHRMMAAALQMSGDDVDDHLLAKREAEEVTTREQLKHTTKVSLKRAQYIQQAKKLAATAAASTLEAEPPSPETERVPGAGGRRRSVLQMPPI